MSESSDLADHLTCTIKASVNLQIGDTKTEISQSGVSVVDINLPFGKTVNVSERPPLVGLFLTPYILLIIKGEIRCKMDLGYV